MIRFIFNRKYYNAHVELHDEVLSSIVLDIPEVQKILTQGGSGECGYDVTSLVGVEITQDKPTTERKE